jgi:hypothetical protein
MPANAKPLSLSRGSRKPGADALSDDAALELGEHAQHLEQRAAS